MRIRLVTFLMTLLCTIVCGLALAQHHAAVTKPAQISIIIDDLGNHRHLDQKVVNLPGPVVCSVLPYRHFTDAVMQQAKANHKPIILHIPMQALADHKLGLGGLTTDMAKQQFIDILTFQLQNYPGIQGVNNHMGSRLTQDNERMQWFMEELANHPLYFVDSRTAGSSVAEKMAKQYQIPTIHRDVFLDNKPTIQAIDKQFQRLIALAKRYGHAVAIGHPYPATLAYLEKAIPKLAEQGIELVPISALLDTSS